MTLNVSEVNGRGAYRRRVYVMILLQGLTIIGLLLWLYQEVRANPFMSLWISEHVPILLPFLTAGGVLATTGAVLTTILVLVLTPRLRHWFSSRGALVPTAKTRNALAAKSEGTSNLIAPRVESVPFYENIESEKLLLLTALLAQGIAMWFITAASVSIVGFPANSFYFLFQLPVSYLWGVTAVFAILWTRTFFIGRLKTAVEISGLLLLALYLIGLPSLTYENARFLDTYFHEGNSIALLNSEKWVGSSVYYVRQFPGAYAYFAMLTSIAGVDPVGLMEFYPIALAWLTVLFIYVTARRLAPQYAMLSSGLSLAGLWFQLHLSPQSLDLILYYGILFIVMRIIEDPRTRVAWTGIAIAVIPAFVGAHPTTPLVMALGMAGFLLLSFLVSRSILFDLLRKTGVLVVVFLSFLTFWWYTVSTEVRGVVERTVFGRPFSELFEFSGVGSEIPQTPEFSYAFTILLQQGISVSVWMLGLFLLLFIRRFRQSQLFLAGLFLAAISAVPLALLGRVDVLQRNYLFSLFPASILLAWILERRVGLRFGWRFIYPALRIGFVVLLVSFAALIPLTRYGVDPFQYIPSSSLQASSVAAQVDDRSVLFLRPTEIGWRFLGPFNGSSSSARFQQPNITGLPGGFIKPFSDATLPGFNLTFTESDRSADYIVMADYVENLYILRFGAGSSTYENSRALFEANVSSRFNLVYSTGTDRIYANRQLG